MSLRIAAEQSKARIESKVGALLQAKEVAEKKKVEAESRLREAEERYRQAEAKLQQETALKVLAEQRTHQLEAEFKNSLESRLEADMARANAEDQR